MPKIKKQRQEKEIFKEKEPEINIKKNEEIIKEEIKSEEPKYILNKSIEAGKESFNFYLENIKKFDIDDKENDINFCNMRRIIRLQQPNNYANNKKVVIAEDFCLLKIKEKFNVKD